MAAVGGAVARNRNLGGRDIPPERLHLTLLFLGDVAPAAEKRVLAAAGRIDFRPFDLVLDQAGCFFRSKVFWLGPSHVPRKLVELAADLRAGVASLGLEADRKDLVPHVTCRRDIAHVIKPVPVQPLVWQARGFALVHSESGPPPRYHVVSHWPLQTGTR